MRFTTSFFVAASVFLTVHANDSNWRLPLDAGARAARAVAARAAVAGVAEPSVNNAASREDYPKALPSYPTAPGPDVPVNVKPSRKTPVSDMRVVSCSDKLIVACEADVNELDAIGWLSYEQAKMTVCSFEDCATCSPLCGQQGGSASA